MARISGIHPGGRCFVDENGDPVLVRGDAPWSATGDLSTAQMTTYLEARAAQGYNLVILSATCGAGNGGPHNNGVTFDDVAPFQTGTLTLNEAYWTRVDHWMTECARLGLTTLFYPADGWTVRWGGALDAGITPAQIRSYSQVVASRYASAPILWGGGGDYLPDNGPLDAKFQAALDGIRDAGDIRPYVMQTNPGSNPPAIGHSYESLYWRERSDWDFIYTYGCGYPEVLASRTEPRWSPKPALFSEFRYLKEFDDNASIGYRRQFAWALTSGSPGVIWGTQDWQFLTGWESRLQDPIIDQCANILDVFESLRWWTLEPDIHVVKSGAGTMLKPQNNTHPGNNDRVTAAHDDSGHTIVYIPSTRTVDLSVDPLTATWIDPANGIRSSASFSGSTFTTPGTNSTGDTDWLLLVRGRGPFRKDGRNALTRSFDSPAFPS